MTNLEYKVTIRVEDNRIGFDNQVKRIVAFDDGSSKPDFEEIIADMAQTLQNSRDNKF